MEFEIIKEVKVFEAKKSLVLTIQGSTQVKVVRSLYTEVSNVPHVARGRVSRVYVLIDRESDG